MGQPPLASRSESQAALPSAPVRALQARHVANDGGGRYGHPSRGRQGRLDGIAPGAQIIAIESDRTYSGFGWALIAAFADERSDIVLIEALLSTRRRPGAQGWTLAVRGIVVTSAPALPETQLLHGR